MLLPLAFIITVLLGILPNARAYSFGTGSCDANVPAVGAPHLTPIVTSVTNGTLALGNLKVSLNGKELTPGTAASFAINQDHVLTLEGTSAYKGILFRLGGSVGTSALAPQSGDALLQVAGICTALQVSSITHTSSAAKTKSSVTLRASATAKSLPLDVTVVIRLAPVSEFYYSQFLLDAVAATPPTAAPVAAPTAKPVKPTSAPVKPTAKPVAAPIPAPVAPPSPAPVAPTTQETPAPSADTAPVAAPTTPETPAPSADTAPVASPTTQDPPTPKPVTFTAQATPPPTMRAPISSAKPTSFRAKGKRQRKKKTGKSKNSGRARRKH